MKVNRNSWHYKLVDAFSDYGVPTNLCGYFWAVVFGLVWALVILLFKTIFKSAVILAKASSENPVTTTLTVMVFYACFNMLEATIETLIFGERFTHWFDVVFQIAFIAYTGLCVIACYDIKENGN